MDVDYLEMEAAWKRVKPSADWDAPLIEGERFHIYGEKDGDFTFTRELNPDGRYKIICNGKRVVEQGETKPL